MSSVRSTYTLGTVRSAFAVLDLFSKERPHWSLPEIAVSLSLNRTTCFRLLCNLEDVGMLQRTGDDRVYQLGPRVLELAAIAMGGFDLRTVARPTLEELGRATGESAALAVIAEGSVLYVDRVESRHALRGGVPAGQRVPLCRGSTGKLLFAHMGLEVRERLLPQVRAYGPGRGKILSERKLRAELEMIRKLGYAVDDEEVEVGLACISAPIVGADGEVVAAISIAGPANRVDVHAAPLIGQVCLAGAEVSRKLGYPDSRGREPVPEGTRASHDASSGEGLLRPSLSG